MRGDAARTTLEDGIGLGESYSKLLTTGASVETIGAGLKVVQGVIPEDSVLAIDTSTLSGQAISIGANAALEALDSLGDPVAIATKVFEDTANAPLLSADLTPEEIEGQRLRIDPDDGVVGVDARQPVVGRLVGGGMDAGVVFAVQPGGEELLDLLQGRDAPVVDQRLGFPVEAGVRRPEPPFYLTSASGFVRPGVARIDAQLGAGVGQEVAAIVGAVVGVEDLRLAPGDNRPLQEIGSTQGRSSAG